MRSNGERKKDQKRSSYVMKMYTVHTISVYQQSEHVGCPHSSLSHKDKNVIQSNEMNYYQLSLFSWNLDTLVSPSSLIS